MIFEIAGTSFADHILSGSYKVNKKPISKDWKDANGKKHQQVIRTQILGSVDMFFRTEAEFLDFVETIEGNRSLNGTVLVELSVNNTGTDEVIEAFLTFEPVRAIDGAWNDYMLKYTLNIEER